MGGGSRTAACGTGRCVGGLAAFVWDAALGQRFHVKLVFSGLKAGCRAHADCSRRRVQPFGGLGAGSWVIPPPCLERRCLWGAMGGPSRSSMARLVIRDTSMREQARIAAGLDRTTHPNRRQRGRPGRDAAVCVRLGSNGGRAWREDHPHGRPTKAPFANSHGWRFQMVRAARAGGLSVWRPTAEPGCGAGRRARPTAARGSQASKGRFHVKPPSVTHESGREGGGRRTPRHRHGAAVYIRPSSLNMAEQPAGQGASVARGRLASRPVSFVRALLPPARRPFRGPPRRIGVGFNLAIVRWQRSLGIL